LNPVAIQLGHEVAACPARPVKFASGEHFTGVKSLEHLPMELLQMRLYSGWALLDLQNGLFNWAVAYSTWGYPV
jgi:hypothetical protein